MQLSLISQYHHYRHKNSTVATRTALSLQEHIPIRTITFINPRITYITTIITQFNISKPHLSNGVTTINYDPHHHHDRHHYYHYHYHPNSSSFTPSTLPLTSRVFRPGTNGAFTPWSEPSECTRSCGGGVELETRTCTNPKPSLNGADCDGVFTQLVPPKQWCNIEVRKE